MFDLFCWLQPLKFSWRVVLATIIGFLGSACGTVGGVGGGGIFVPMLTLIVGFDTKSAAAISKCKFLFFIIFNHPVFAGLISLCVHEMLPS